jgi:hypothetical protein
MQKSKINREKCETHDVVVSSKENLATKGSVLGPVWQGFTMEKVNLDLGFTVD